MYLIEILHQTTTQLRLVFFLLCCILSKFYIKPQHPRLLELSRFGCILSKFYIKPQLRPLSINLVRCCILSKFYIKPQLEYKLNQIKEVVSYRNSTSNHNRPRVNEKGPRVVSYRNSTSNHNASDDSKDYQGLYLIEILHQTTTCGKCEDCLRRCILSKFYIKPQRRGWLTLWIWRCILSKFYIKPQLGRQRPNFCCVVSYRNSTSNHNTPSVTATFPKLYLIEILHQTTTRAQLLWLFSGCILSKFYIKPQLCQSWRSPRCVVSYRNSTSNHNVWLSKATHKRVVSYRNSTSNHNSCLCISEETAVVSYRNSTSNHNLNRRMPGYCSLYLIEILHQTTTDPGMEIRQGVLYLIEILHQTTTVLSSKFVPVALYLIEILHQTTTPDRTRRVS